MTIFLIMLFFTILILGYLIHKKIQKWTTNRIRKDIEKHDISIDWEKVNQSKKKVY